MSIVFCVNDKCNNKCMMCTNPPEGWPARDGSFDYSYEAIVDRFEVERSDIEKVNSIYLTGGEPSIHPRFFDILEYLKNNFSDKRINLLSNGRAFAYPEFAQKAMSASDNMEIDVSLYGPSAEVHDAVTRCPGSFEQTVRGVGNLLANKNRPADAKAMAWQGGVKLGLRIVITEFSFRYMKEFVELIEDNFAGLDRVIFIFMEYEGHAEVNLKSIGIRYNELKCHLNDVFDDFVRLDEMMEVCFYHFPLCTIDKKFWKYVHRTWPEDEVEFSNECERCAMKKYCVGIHKDYKKLFGDSEFRSIEDCKVVESDNFYKPIKSLR